MSSQKESTVRTVLKRLEEKGHLTHRVDQRTFVYAAADTRARAAARAVQRIVDRFCSGSVEEVLTGLVDARIVDSAELLAGLIQPGYFGDLVPEGSWERCLC